MSDPESESSLPSHWIDQPLEMIASICPVQHVEHPAFERAGVEVVIKREDLLHPALGGNKFYKLYHPLRQLVSDGFKSVLSFGGAYSNHIYALAAAGQAIGLETLGVIRGERPAQLNPTLQDAEKAGMKLFFISRRDYRRKVLDSIRGQLQNSHNRYYTIPEGGSTALGSLGCRTWCSTALSMCPWVPDHICLPGGTGGTLAGVYTASGAAQVHGYLVLKGQQHAIDGWRNEIINKAIALGYRDETGSRRLNIHDRFHLGGYGRCPSQLAEFIHSFEATTGIPLDPVYTAKMLWGVVKMAESGEWGRGSRLLLLHTGGLQGRRGFNLHEGA